MKQDHTGKQRILVVDDEEALRGILSKALQKEGYDVTVSDSGKTAQAIVGMEKFDAIISDIHMPNSMVSGIALLHYVKEHCPTPMILITGFAEISETQEAFELGADGFLAKPFKREELLAALKSVIKEPELPPVAPEEEDSKYCKLNLEDFISGKEINYSIFIRLAQNRFVKIAHQGEDLAADRIQQYREKGIKHLYLLKEDFFKYLEFNRILSHVVKGSAKVEPKKKMALVKHANEVLLQHLYSNEVSKEAFDSAKSIVESTVSILAEQTATADLVELLNQHSDHLYAHSLGVSLYAAMLCQQVKWTSPTTLFKASIAGLMHDIGKKEIDRAILDKPRAKLTIEERKLLETHPVRGMEILSQSDSFPNEVMQIVYQHHENCSGTGFPAKISKNKIHPLARLIAVCDEFCKLIIAGPDHKPMPPKQAIERLRVLYSDTLDPTFMVALGALFGVEIQYKEKPTLKAG